MLGKALPLSFVPSLGARFLDFPRPDHELNKPLFFTIYLVSGTQAQTVVLPGPGSPPTVSSIPSIQQLDKD
jgi:hypothetical protein